MVQTLSQDNPDLFRGVLHQVYSLVLYLLIRRLEHPDLQVVVESLEDAVFTLMLHKFRLAEDLRRLAVRRGIATTPLAPPNWRTC
jgi:hypothetical protein